MTAIRIAVVAGIIGFGFWHKEYLADQIKWMEKHGYSDQEIRLTIESENPLPDYP